MLRLQGVEPLFAIRHAQIIKLEVPVIQQQGTLFGAMTDQMHHEQVFLRVHQCIQCLQGFTHTGSGSQGQVITATVDQTHLTALEIEHRPQPFRHPVHFTGKHGLGAITAHHQQVHITNTWPLRGQGGQYRLQAAGLSV